MNIKKSQPNRTVSILRRLFSGIRRLLAGAVVLACATGSAAPASAQSGDWVVRDLLGSKEISDIPEHTVTLYCPVDEVGDLNGCKDGLLEVNQDELWLNRGDALAQLKKDVLGVAGFEQLVTLGKKKENGGKVVANDEVCISVDLATAAGGERRGQWRCLGIVATEDCDTCGILEEEVPIRTSMSDQTFCAEAQRKVDEALGASTRSVAWAVRHDLAKAGEEKATTIITCPGYSIQPTLPRIELEGAHLGVIIPGLYTPHGCYDGYC